MKAHIFHKGTQIDTDLNLFCAMFSVIAYTMGVNQTKQLVVTTAMVYYQSLKFQILLNVPDFRIGFSPEKLLTELLEDPWESKVSHGSLSVGR